MPGPTASLSPSFLSAPSVSAVLRAAFLTETRVQLKRPVTPTKQTTEILSNRNKNQTGPHDRDTQNNWIARSLHGRQDTASPATSNQILIGKQIIRTYSN